MTIATTIRLLLCAAILAVPAAARSGEPDARHAHAVMVRGDRAMGFSHAKTAFPLVRTVFEKSVQVSVAYVK